MTRHTRTPAAAVVVAVVAAASTEASESRDEKIVPSNGTIRLSRNRIGR